MLCSNRALITLLLLLPCLLGAISPALGRDVSTATPAQEDFQINSGLNGAWYNPETTGQGFFIDVYPDRGEIFLSWFTFDTSLPGASVPSNLGHPSQRWLTAQGTYSGNVGVLFVTSSENGLFDESSPNYNLNLDVGTMSIQFTDCTVGTVTYDLTSVSQQGTIPIQRIVPDNVSLCEFLNDLR